MNRDALTPEQRARLDSFEPPLRQAVLEVMRDLEPIAFRDAVFAAQWSLYRPKDVIF